MPDRWPKPPFSSIAAVGFALNAYAIGAERGYVTRAQARARVLTTLQVPARCAAGHLARPGLRLPGLLLSLRQLHHRQALRRFRAIYRGHRAAHGRRAVRRRLLRPGRRRRGARSASIADELYQRVNWPWAIAHRARHPHGLEPGAGVRRPRLARLQRGHAGVHPGARQSYLPGRAAHLGCLDLRLLPRLGHARRTDPPDLRAHVRPPVHAHLDRPARHQGRIHVAAGLRLLREQPARGAGAARLCHPQSASTGAATDPTSGDSPPRDGPGDFELPYLGQKRKFFSYAARGVGPHTKRTTTARSRPPRCWVRCPSRPRW